MTLTTLARKKDGARKPWCTMRNSFGENDVDVVRCTTSLTCTGVGRTSSNDRSLLGSWLEARASKLASISVCKSRGTPMRRPTFAPLYFFNSFSIAPTRSGSVGVVFGLKRATTSPLRSTRNFSKFQEISSAVPFTPPPTLGCFLIKKE